MNFKSGIAGLGGGSVCFAGANGDEMIVMIKQGGAIRKVTVNLATKAMRNHGIVSLADECFPTASGRIERLGEVYFVAE